MVGSEHKRAIGVFSNRQAAEQSLNELKSSGFPMEKISIIAKNVDQGENISGTQTSDRVGNQKVESATGVVADTLTSATWGTILVGLGSLVLPGIGPILAAGTLGVALVTGVAGTGVGAAAIGNLVKALTELGIPEAQARAYSDRLLQGDYLTLIEGTDEEINRAETIFNNQGIQAWGVYPAGKTSE